MESISTDVVIVGAGPAGIFAALSLLETGNPPRILIVEKGLAIEERSCPKHKVGHCVECDPCRITTGFSGAGAFSDGKLSLSCEVGGDLPELIGAETAQKTIETVDGMYLHFGADEHVEGVGEKSEVKEIRRRAIQAGLKLVDCPIRHLGTEKAQEIYGRIEHYLLDAGVEIRFQCECHQVLVEDEVCQGIVIEQAGTTTA
ncbi:MAG: FAD-dependent oxidoreductase, partial [Raoultibacter sp.]